MSEKVSAPASPFGTWWRDHVVKAVDHRSVITHLHDEAIWSGRFAFMTLMSAGIAVLGLLLSSPAVVIGAMLISPLMGPILGLGFGLALFDFAEIRRALLSLIVGVVLAVLFCALIVLVSPLQTVTNEIAARTRPNLFDLGVAIFSGLAGTYATIRGRQGAIVGVAIAVALMPPLAVMGFGLATLNLPILWGASFLFLTNLMAIGFSAAVLARIYGFAGRLSPRQTWLQVLLVLGTLAALAVPLGLALRQIAWEAVASGQARQTIAAQFDENARVSQLVVDYDADPIRVRAVVFTPAVRPRRCRGDAGARGPPQAGRRGRHRAGAHRQRERAGGATRRRVRAIYRRPDRSAARAAGRGASRPGPDRPRTSHRQGARHSAAGRHVARLPGA